jgi:hypothetical protein
MTCLVYSSQGGVSDPDLLNADRIQPFSLNPDPLTPLNADPIRIWISNTKIQYTKNNGFLRIPVSSAHLKSLTPKIPTSAKCQNVAFVDTPPVIHETIG